MDDFLNISMVFWFAWSFMVYNYSVFWIFDMFMTNAYGVYIMTLCMQLDSVEEKIS